MFLFNRKRVLMTGFGPFRENKTNMSWEGVKHMQQKEIEYKYNIILCRKEIKVVYDEVDKCVPLLWDNFQPHLTIHVGVSEAVSCFVLETRASKKMYFDKDEEDRLPKNNENVCGGPVTILTQLDVAAICRKFNRNPPEDKLHAKMSGDAGQFLCDYIYYTSLSYGRSPTLFIHVPPKTYTTKQLAQGLQRILKLCLDQLSH